MQELNPEAHFFAVNVPPPEITSREAEDGKDVSITRGYESSAEHLRDELRRLDGMIARQVLHLRSRQPANPLDQFKGLVISDEEVAAILSADRAGTQNWDGRNIEEEGASAEEIKGVIEERVKQTADAEHVLSLLRLCQLFHLSPYERECILICLAPELDRRYEKLYAYLQDDVTCRKPTLDLILRLSNRAWDERIALRAVFDGQLPLLRYRLVQTHDQSPEGQLSVLSRPLKLDDRIVSFLLEQERMDSRLESFVCSSSSSQPLGDGGLDEVLSEKIVQFIRHRNVLDAECECTVFALRGSDDGGKHATVQAVARELGRPVLTVDGSALTGTSLASGEAGTLVAREARLRSAILCVQRVDGQLSDEDPHRRQLDRVIGEAIRDVPLTFLLTGRRWLGSVPWQDSVSGKEIRLVSVLVESPDEKARARIWRQRLGPEERKNLDCETLASRFALTGGQIGRALRTARERRVWLEGEETLMEAADLYAACREQSDHTLAVMAKKIEPRNSWADIVLPTDTLTQLHELCARVNFRSRVLSEWGFDRKLSQGKGVNALFAGPSGAGKTMAAEVIAGDLGLDLYRIDLSGVVSKYIGETEKNLDRIFTAARGANAILFFDEADALFGKRSEVRDSHDRYANIEVSYLLQKIEEYEGVVLLATNLRQNLDDSFLRRLAFTIHFPLPDETMRGRIWSAVWPPETPLGEDVDLNALARQYKLSGGHIRNIALAAAFLAAQSGTAVTMSHLLQATDREFQKLGKTSGPVRADGPERPGSVNGFFRENSQVA